jgi:4-hydroxy-tetrahydrodipicolinate synthase
LLTLKQRRPNFRVLQGHEHAAMASLMLGADGLIPGLANVAPKLLVELVRAARTGDVVSCQRLNEQVFDLTRIYTQGIGLAGIYAAAARLGLSQDVPAEPWLPVGAVERDKIDSILRTHDLLPRAVAAA